MRMRAPMDDNVTIIPNPAAEAVYRSRGVACIRQPTGYAIVRLTDQRIVAELRWSPRACCYTFVPCDSEAQWLSGTLAEITVWMRRLGRGKDGIHAKT